MFDIDQIRIDFPILKRELRPGIPLVYLDSAATSQKPYSVLEQMDAYYRLNNANIHRGVHQLAEESTAMYEKARRMIADFIHAPSPQELVFTRNTTESINLVAFGWARKFLQPGDLILLTEMEHHSNIVPWQILAEERGLRLEFIPLNPDYTLAMDRYERLLEKKPRLVAFTHMSNVLGTINPARRICELARQAGAISLVDGAQSVPHFAVNVQDIGCDFMAFSAHKMLGPTGIGALWGRRALLEEMSPFMGGGDMIRKVTFEGFSTNELPYKFEAGTPAVAEAVGFGAAVEYLNAIGMDAIEAHEQEITAYALETLSQLHGLTHYGPSGSHKGGVFAFEIEDVHPHDISQILDQDGIAVRAGHHCAMPLHHKLSLPATTRASFYLYTRREEIDKLAVGLQKVIEVFK